MDTDLFRTQALDARRQRGPGDPLDLGPRWTTALATAAVAVMVVAAALLVVVEVPRRATVRGYLAPETGVIRIRPSSGGTIAEVLVQEGDEVPAGAPLMRLVSQRSTRADVDLATSSGRDFALMRQELLAQRRLAGATLESDLANLERRSNALAREVDALAAQLDAARARAAAASDRLDALAPLAGQGLLPMTQVHQQRDRIAELEVEALRTEQLLLERSRQLGEVESERGARGRQARARIAELDAALARNALETRDVGSSLDAVIRAPAPGVVLRVAIRPGASVQAGQLAITMARPGEALRAVMLVPTRVAGMLAVGQQVVMRLDAFPYQRFGIRRATVAKVGGSVMLPGESEAPMLLAEPVFEVVAALQAQHVDAYGRRWPLRTDLTFEADVVLERATLVQRLLDPLRAIARRNG